MEGCLKMKEEKITITLLKWLQNNGWQIVCFDFPQSGTGISLHPNSDLRTKTKNKGAIVPDIVANKDGISLFFENKDRFVLSDFQKVNYIKLSGDYSDAIMELLKKYPTTDIFYGIGLPHSKNNYIKFINYEYLVDFILVVHLNFEVEILKGKMIFDF